MNPQLGGLHSIANSLEGVSQLTLSKFYTSTILPSTLLGSCAWMLLDGDKYFGNNKKQIKKMLEYISESAALAISGGSKNIAGAVYRQSSLPLTGYDFVLEHSKREFLKLASTPAYAEIEKLRQNSNQGKHQSPCSKREREYENSGRWLSNLEKRKPHVWAPWWNSPNTDIASNKDMAIDEHYKRISDESDKPENLFWYSDGSAIAAHVGAAACTRGGQERTAYLGPLEERRSDVLVAELYGVILALQLARDCVVEGSKFSKIVFFSDSQRVIRFIAAPRMQSRQYLLEFVKDLVDKFSIPVDLVWIPSKAGIAWNEHADYLAKKATGWRPDGTRGSTAERVSGLLELISVA